MSSLDPVLYSQTFLQLRHDNPRLLEVIGYVMPFLGNPVSPPKTEADDGSVFTARKIHVNAKSLKMKIETESDAGQQSGNADHPGTRADYSARGGSVINKDDISGDVDGDVDLSVSVKRSGVCAGQVDETLAPSSQTQSGP